MIRGPLGKTNYKPQFTGHETFPVRYGWIKKAFEAVNNCKDSKENKSVFIDKEAIARFGVGKNMVAAIRHWATATGVIIENPSKNQLNLSDLWKYIIAEDGLDPYMENPTTLWLLHWFLTGKPNKTTWFWSFNHFPNLIFDRETFVKSLVKLTENQNWGKISPNTIKRDVECFVRTYAIKTKGKKYSIEDSLESPLTELGLVKPIGKQGIYRFVKGRKTTLGMGLFVWAVEQFWQNYFPNEKSISFEALAHEPGSPGRVFLLDENDLAERLAKIPDITTNLIQWSETAGLRQLIKIENLKNQQLFNLIKNDYAPKGVKNDI
jgi:hypothetical protein